MQGSAGADEPIRGNLGEGETHAIVLQPIRAAARLVPLTLMAVFTGAIAGSGQVLASVGAINGDWPLLLAMACVLALAWLVVWAVIAGVNWAEPLTGWHRWTRGEPVRALPYAQTGSDAAFLAQRLGQLRSWLQVALMPRHGSALYVGVAAIVVMAVLAAALGAQAVLLTIVALCLTQVAVVACRGDGHPNTVLHSLVAIALPLMLGSAIMHPLSPDAVIAAAGVAIAFAGIAMQSALLRNAGYAILLLVMIALRQPVGAFLIAVVWAPQLILNLQRGGYAWLIAGMLAYAVAMVV